MTTVHEDEQGAMYPKWLEWSTRLQALAQSGLTYAQNPFEIERYEAVREIAAEMVAAHSDLDLETVRATFARERGYATPKVDVRGVVIEDNRVLLVKERKDGLWTLPGGWVDVGEPPSMAVVREVYEESGYRTRAVKLLALYDRNKHAHPPSLHHIYKLFFQCQLVGGSPAESVETEGAMFFCEVEIPDLSLPRVTPAQIARFFEHHRHPDWPTDFD
jgi:ADP-ribose pyrophosphatase YjhB (NUDIX family)